MSPATRGLPVSHRAYLERLLVSQRLVVRSVHRRGPRFFVAAVDSPHGPALLKVCLAAPLGSAFLREKFRREIVFLQFAGRRPTSALARAVPKIYAAGTGSLVWYLREHVTGQGFDLRGGNVIFRSSFFTPAMVRHLSGLFTGLHALTPTAVPAPLRPKKHRYDSVAQLRLVLKDNRLAYLRWLGAQTLASLETFLASVEHVYDASPVRLAHFEPYPVHFFLNRGQLKLIDWENIYWAAPVRDWMILWMRANGHAAWQRGLVLAAKKDIGPLLGKNFPLIWHVDRLMLSCFMLTANTTHASQRGIQPLRRAAQRFIQSAMKNPASLYEYPVLRG